jgi:hypothetical protein
MRPLIEFGVRRSADTARTSVIFRGGRAKICMKMDEIISAVKVVARTGCVEAVRVFDLEPRNEEINETSW